MTIGLERTLRVLSSTSNEAAVAALIPALDSSYAEVREGALRALLDRRSPTGQRELLRRWDKLDEHWKQLIAEHPARIASAVRDAILGTDKQLCVNGCDAVLWIREYDLIPALIHAVEERQHVYADLAAHTLVSLAELLHQDTHDKQRRADRRDPRRLRAHVVTALEQAVERSDQHQRREIIEAFLVLANRENATLKHLLKTPRHGSYLLLLDILKHSNREAILELLYSFVDDPQPPQCALNLIAHRRDVSFLKKLMQHVGPEPSVVVRGNFKRLDALVWAQGDLSFLHSMRDDELAGVVQLVVASGMNRLEVFDVVKFVLEHGNTGGRRAAAAALSEFGGATANHLTMQGLEDADPVVQSHMVSQLRHRGIPGAITRLVESVESPHQEVRDAARESLSEFNFKRFISAYDMLDEAIRKSTGMLVRRIDDSAVDGLAGELKSPTRTRKFRALEAAVAMGAVEDVQALIIELLSDSDHFLRGAAARALGDCNTPLARQALRDAMNDRSPSVQEEAENALRQLTRQHNLTDVTERLTHVFRVAEQFPLMSDTPPSNS